MKLLIYKTNIKTLNRLKKVQSFLNNHPVIQRWSIDLEDIDKVLKIVAATKTAEPEILQWLGQRGIYCEELK